MLLKIMIVFSGDDKLLTRRYTVSGSIIGLKCHIISHEIINREIYFS
jgi:hypothetical protein